MIISSLPLTMFPIEKMLNSLHEKAAINNYKYEYLTK